MRCCLSQMRLMMLQNQPLPLILQVLLDCAGFLQRLSSAEEEVLPVEY